jgi:zinc/manganese transport system substrate-binding protein
MLSFASDAAEPTVVAAENVYGDVAQQIAGPDAAVFSILSNPAQDPHLFEPGPSVAIRVGGANVAVYNGLGYDPWMAKLLAVTPGADRATLIAADLAGRKTGENPHLWYDLAVMRLMAKTIADALAARDPAHAADYAVRLRYFDESLETVTAKIAIMHGKSAGLPVTATEPVFEYMARAVGLEIRNPDFQRAVMNDTEPAARDVAAFEDDLKGRKVRVLLYNTQASSPAAERMKHVAEQAKVPVVGVSETLPPGRHYQDWIADELDALDMALAKGGT